MLVQLKYKFQAPTGAPYAGYTVKAVAFGLNNPVRTYSSAGVLADADGTLTTNASGVASGYFDDKMPVQFILLDTTGKVLERSPALQSGDVYGGAATKPEEVAMAAAGTTQATGAAKRVLNTTTGTIASHTFNLPLAPEDGQEVLLTTRGAVTSLTVAAPTAGHVIVAPAVTALTAGQTVGWVYSASDTSWSRIQ